MRRDSRSVRLALLGLAFVAGCGCPGGPTTAAALEIDASEAVLYGAATRLRVRGAARVDEGIDHPVTLDTETAAVTTWFHLVPIVDDGWNEGDPIPLWITCASTERDVSSWTAALASALERGAIEVKVVAHAGLQARERPKGWHDALEALAAADGPVSDPRAPIAVWPPP